MDKNIIYSPYVMPCVSVYILKDGRIDGNLSAMVPSLPGEIKKINVSINSCQCTVGQK